MTGAVLAGGLGTRMAGASKPAVLLAGRPLILRPLEALVAACERVGVVCRRDTGLPPLPAGVERWDEPDGPRHPAAGIAHALERAEGSVLVCAADMPFVTVDVLRALLAAAESAPEAAAVVADADGRLQPVLGVYRRSALGALREVGDAPLTAAVAALDPARVAVARSATRSVNTPADLAAAARALAG